MSGGGGGQRGGGGRVYVCGREDEWRSGCVVCVREKMREGGCVRGREREGECVCVCVFVCVCVCV